MVTYVPLRNSMRLLMGGPGRPSSSPRSNAVGYLPTSSAFRLSFASFGLLNNVVYVLILSSAADLVTTDVPKVSPVSSELPLVSR